MPQEIQCHKKYDIDAKTTIIPHLVYHFFLPHLCIYLQSQSKSWHNNYTFSILFEKFRRICLLSGNSSITLSRRTAASHAQPWLLNSVSSRIWKQPSLPQTMGWYPSKQMWTDKHDTICQWWFLFAVHDVQSQHIKMGCSTLPFPKITSREFLITVWVYHPYYHFSWAVLIPTWAMWASLKTQWFHISKSSAVPWKMHKQDAIQAPWHWTLWGMGKSCCEKYAQ